MTKRFAELIYAPERATEQAASKAETHTPKIEAPDKAKKGEAIKIRVRVGPHPNQPEHSIRSIELWFAEDGRPFNPIRLATIELEPGYAEPDVELTIKVQKSGTLYAIAYCNLHGIWENSKRIEIED